MYRLDGKAETGAALTHHVNLVLSLALHEVILLALVAELVLALEVEVQDDVEEEGEGEHADTGTVARAEVRLVLVGEEEGRGHTRGVTDSQVHAGREGSLSVAGVVGGHPCEGDARGQEDANGDEAAAGIRDTVALARDEHGIADDSRRDTAHDKVASALGLVAEVGADEVDDGTDGVDGDSHGLDLSRVPLAHSEDDGRQEDDEGVEHSKAGEESEAIAPGSPVLDGINDVLLEKLAAVAGTADLLLVDLAEVLTVLIGEKLGSLGAVGEDEGDDDASDDGGDTIDEDDPSPRAPAKSVVHEADTIGDETTSNTRGGSGGEEVGDAQGETVTAVEHGQVQHDAGEETSLKDTEEETAGDQGTSAADPGAEGGGDTPAQSETGEVAGGLELLDDEVGGGLEELQSC